MVRNGTGRIALVLVVAGAVLVVTLGIMARGWFGTTAARDLTVEGTYTSDSDIRVAVLVIPGGHHTIGYSLDVFLEPQSAPASVRCGMVETGGRIDFFEASRTSAEAGGWTRLEFEARYSLPRVELGIRCSPNQDGALTAVFRNAELHAVPITD